LTSGGETGDSSNVEHHAPTDAQRQEFLAGLPARLAGAIGGPELRAVLTADLPGVTQRVDLQSVWVGGRRLRSSLPWVTLHLDPPVDVRWLIEMWRIDAPVAVSGDVHQQRWHLRVGGPELPDPFNRRIVSTLVTAGRWQIDVVLSGRPPGPLPDVVSGASPAYDLIATGGWVSSLSVERAWLATDVVTSDEPTSSSPHVVVRAGDTTLAAAYFHLDAEALFAHSFSVELDAVERHAGSALIDALEALALDEGVSLVRLDRSVTAVGTAVPFERHGYRWIGPAGDEAIRSQGHPDLEFVAALELLDASAERAGAGGSRPAPSGVTTLRPSRTSSSDE
jgi:hypothetical protein